MSTMKKPLDLSRVLAQLPLTEHEQSAVLCAMADAAARLEHVLNAPDDAVVLIWYPGEGWLFGAEHGAQRRNSTVELLVDISDPANDPGPPAPPQKWRTFRLELKKNNGN